MHIAALILSYLGAMLIGLEVWKQSLKGQEIVPFLRLRGPNEPSSIRELLPWTKKPKKPEIPLSESFRNIVLSFVGLVMTCLLFPILISEILVKPLEILTKWMESGVHEIVKEMDPKDLKYMNDKTGPFDIKRVPVQAMFAVSMFTVAFILELVK